MEFKFSIILSVTETHIKPGVKEHADHVISQLTNMNNDFLRHKSRLAAVRKEIKTKQIQLPVDNICELELDKEVPDFVSDITSIADSVSTGMSQMSISSKSSRSIPTYIFSKI